MYSTMQGGADTHNGGNLLGYPTLWPVQTQDAATPVEIDISTHQSSLNGWRGLHNHSAVCSLISHFDSELSHQGRTALGGEIAIGIGVSHVVGPHAILQGTVIKAKRIFM